MDRAPISPLVTRRRQDIQGLRAIAVLLVALDHAGVGFLEGGYVGVDVFFVLSGYLITGVLVTAGERSRRDWFAKRERRSQYFVGFYARRARRILPAAALTLAATDIASSHLLNLERAHQVLVDTVSAAFFVANFHFAAIGTDYFAKGAPPSPLQHFWSLSVEEQFYVVWPVLVAVALLGGTLLPHARRRVGLRGVALLAGIITAASFAFAVHDTHSSPVTAYFSTPARAWELGLGALLAVTAGRVARLPATVLAVTGWVGVAAIVAAACLYSASTPFPGAAALLPTLGAAAVIAAGLRTTQLRFALARLLALRPFGYVGDRSYTFYLWHWPVLVIAMEHTGHSLPVGTNLLLLVGAFLLSIVTYRYFENPLRHASRLRGPTGLVLWPATILIALFVASTMWANYQNSVNLTLTFSRPEVLKEAQETSLTASTQPIAAGWRPSSPSALITAVAAVHAGARLPSNLQPSPLALPQSEYKVPLGCIALPGHTTSTPCSLGDTSGTKSLVVFGDSHALMWVPAVASFGRLDGYDVRPLLKYGCTPGTWTGRTRTSECNVWYKWATSQIRALHPSLVVVTGLYDTSNAESAEPAVVDNLAAFSNAVRSRSRRIAVIGDPPEQEQQPTDCLLASHATMQRCSHVEFEQQREATLAVESATKAFGVFLNTTPWFCYQETCPMVVGHTVLFYDESHITSEYISELTPLFDAAMAHVLAVRRSKVKS